MSDSIGVTCVIRKQSTLGDPLVLSALRQCQPYYPCCYWVTDQSSFPEHTHTKMSELPRRATGPLSRTTPHVYSSRSEDLAAQRNRLLSLQRMEAVAGRRSCMVMVYWKITLEPGWKLTSSRLPPQHPPRLLLGIALNVLWKMWTSQRRMCFRLPLEHASQLC